MGQYTSYYLYQRYEQREGQDPIPCTPNVYSIDGDGTMQKVIKLDNDPNCGYTPEPTEPIYRWYQMPISEGYVCNECPELQYRWVESGTTCVGYDKWNRSIEQYSEDSGVTWHNTNPLVYSATSLIEADSEDCGYVPPTFSGKWLATYNGGTTSSAECDSTSAITNGEVTTTSLATIEIGNCVTLINSYAFYYSTSLTSVTIPNSVTELEEGAFYGCTSLTSIGIPSSVTIIADEVFSGCTSLTSVTIPSGATTIGARTFRNCSSLTSITVEATTPPSIGSRIFEDTNNCPIYVPAASVSAYQSESAWNKYASRIQAIP